MSRLTIDRNDDGSFDRWLSVKAAYELSNTVPPHIEVMMALLDAAATTHFKRNSIEGVGSREVCSWYVRYELETTWDGE